MPKLLEFLSQFEIVVDLTVIDYPGSFILVVNWLVTAGNVDDGETAHAQTNRAVEVKTVIVRTTMTDRRAHACQYDVVDGFTVVPNYSNDATHLRLKDRRSWTVLRRS